MKRWVLAMSVAVLAVGLAWGQTTVNFFNGVQYTFPPVQGGAGTVLTNDGTGDLDWASVPSPEGLWTGSVVMSTTTCPAGWTRLSAADGRVLRGSATAGTTGGSDTHSHTMSGTSAAQGVSVSGSTGSASPAISGTTGSTDLTHDHNVTSGTADVESGGTQVITSVSVNDANPSHSHGSGSLAADAHSHGSGSLAGGSHSHGVGSLATSTESNVPAYYAVILCRHD